MASIHRTLSPSSHRLLLLHRRPIHRLPISRFLLFFLLGFTSGLFPFAHLHFDLDLDLDLNLRSLPFPSPPPPSLPHHPLNAQFIQTAQLGRSKIKQAIVDDGGESKVAKLVIVITPTYNRAAEQGHGLHRLAHTLRSIEPPLLWIVVEAGDAITSETSMILRKSGVMYRHLFCSKCNNSTKFKDRGVHQRNIALEHIETHCLNGIVYFADDDNVYSPELFDRIRQIRKFGTWPVATLLPGKSKATLEGPVCDGDRIIGWHTNEKNKRLRRFHVDMSGFAFNSTLLWESKRRYRGAWNAIRQLDNVPEGFQETTFIEQLVEDESEMEAVPLGCNRILNWHLHLEFKKLPYPKGWQLSEHLNASSQLGNMYVANLT